MKITVRRKVIVKLLICRVIYSLSKPSNKHQVDTQTVKVTVYVSHMSRGFFLEALLRSHAERRYQSKKSQTPEVMPESQSSWVSRGRVTVSCRQYSYEWWEMSMASIKTVLVGFVCFFVDVRF